MPGKRRVISFWLAVTFMVLTAGAIPGFAQEGATEALGASTDPEQDVVEPGGARWLYIGEMLYSSTIWSGALNGAFRIEGKPNTAVWLLATPATFFGAIALTRNRATTLGMVSLSSIGTLQGYGVGYALGDLLVNWDDIDSFRIGAGARVGLGLAGSLAGHFLGFYHAERERLNWGNSEMLGHAALWGAGYGALVPYLAVPMTGARVAGFPWQAKVVELGLLGGWGAGTYFWNQAGPRDYTTGDAISMYNGTALSVLSGLAVGVQMPDAWTENEWGLKGAILAGAAANAGGLVGSYYFHRTQDLDFGRSLAVTLGTAHGATSVGLVTAMMLAAEGEGLPSQRITLPLTALGGWGGFFLTHRLLEADAAASRTWTVGDDFSLFTGSGLGILSGVAAYELIASENSGIGRNKPALLVGGLVNLGGLTGSYYFLRDRDVTFGQSVLAYGGSMLGATMVGGAAALLFSDQYGNASGRVTMATAAAGGWLGYFLTHALVGSGSQGQANARPARLPFQVSLAPENAAVAWFCAKQKLDTRVPLVTVRF